MPAVGVVDGGGVGGEVLEGEEEGGETGYLGDRVSWVGVVEGMGRGGTWIRAEREKGAGEERRWRGCLRVISS